MTLTDALAEIEVALSATPVFIQADTMHFLRRELGSAARLGRYHLNDGYVLRAGQAEELRDYVRWAITSRVTTKLTGDA